MYAEHKIGSVKLFSRLNIFEEIGVRYGVLILWPVLWLQRRLLRRSLAFLDDRAKSQTITYALDAVIDDALREDLGTQAGISSISDSTLVEHSLQYLR
ncbi:MULTISPECIES: hypothetical protein [Rhizobium/Agrobacterium group]|jgi:hypothetical protein|uniref:hypothetical protein n=1 Tax=Rhizobium/Agrobacterium group TaxID=227290 RepID=UPI0005A08365|nr:MULTISPECIES: hypothetical protein [Rhizobium/Agrobacterium group]